MISRVLVNLLQQRKIPDNRDHKASDGVPIDFRLIAPNKRRKGLERRGRYAYGVLFESIIELSKMRNSISGIYFDKCDKTNDGRNSLQFWRVRAF